jgi:Flp pilus assembly protein protease CpaA
MLSTTLLARTEWWEFLDHPDTLVLAIPIVAILIGGVVSITRLLIRHRERMAMIERGMHPRASAHSA